jgi:hypothetical protein
MKPDRFAQHLREDATMRFGNAFPIHGRDACRQTWARICATVDEVAHDVVAQWDVNGATIAETNVTYTRKDGVEVTIPVVTIFRPGGDELIRDDRVFIDLAPVFADEA